MDFSKMMKEAQRLQKEMMDAQKRLESLEFQGISGGGTVSLVLTGGAEMRSLHIDDSLLQDKGMLEDLLIAAYHDAKKKMEQKRGEEMGSLTQGMPPGLL